VFWGVGGMPFTVNSTLPLNAERVRVLPKYPWQERFFPPEVVSPPHLDSSRRSLSVKPLPSVGMILCLALSRGGPFSLKPLSLHLLGFRGNEIE